MNWATVLTGAGSWNCVTGGTEGEKTSTKVAAAECCNSRRVLHNQAWPSRTLLSCMSLHHVIAPEVEEKQRSAHIGKRCKINEVCPTVCLCSVHTDVKRLDEPLGSDDAGIAPSLWGRDVSQRTRDRLTLRYTHMLSHIQTEIHMKTPPWQKKLQLTLGCLEPVSSKQLLDTQRIISGEPQWSDTVFMPMVSSLFPLTCCHSAVQ